MSRPGTAFTHARVITRRMLTISIPGTAPVVRPLPLDVQTPQVRR